MIRDDVHDLANARMALEAHDLIVRPNNEHSLWIANRVRDTGDGILLSNDACALLQREQQWVAVFPAKGMRTYEVPGTLSEGVALILLVYARLRAEEGILNEAFRHCVLDPDSYLNGR